LRIKRKDHIRDILVNHGIYQFKNSLNLVKLKKSKFILTIEFGLGLEKKSSIDGSAVIEQKVAGGLVDLTGGRSFGQRLRRAGGQGRRRTCLS